MVGRVKYRQKRKALKKKKKKVTVIFTEVGCFDSSFRLELVWGSASLGCIQFDRKYWPCRIICVSAPEHILSAFCPKALNPLQKSCVREGLATNREKHQAMITDVRYFCLVGRHSSPLLPSPQSHICLPLQKQKQQKNKKTCLRAIERLSANSEYDKQQT